MKAEQVDQALRQKFVGEGARLVFWHDENGEFAEYVAGGLPKELAAVQVLDLTQVGGFSAKLRLEREDPPFDVLRGLCQDNLQEGLFDLTAEPELISIFEKMDLLERFWSLMRDEFGYTAETPSVAGLLCKLFISEVIYQADGAKMDSLMQHRLPAKGGRNAVVKKANNTGLASNRYFWRTYDKKEIDYIEERDGVLSGFEFKWNPNRSMKVPQEFLATYPGSSIEQVDRGNYWRFLL